MSSLLIKTKLEHLALREKPNHPLTEAQSYALNPPTIGDSGCWEIKLH